MIHDVKKQFDKLHKVYYFQFDWTCQGVTILRFKWYPGGKGDNPYPLWYPQSYNILARKWYDVVRLSNELRQTLLDECSEMWGMPKVVEQVVEAKPLVKMGYYPPAFGDRWITEEQALKVHKDGFGHWEGILIEER